MQRRGSQNFEYLCFGKKSEITKGQLSQKIGVISFRKFFDIRKGGTKFFFVFKVLETWRNLYLQKL